MNCNRRTIMLVAWAIVRRFKGNGEPHRALLSRALKAAWSKAKFEVDVARRSAARRAAELELITRDPESLRGEIIALENRTTLGAAGLDRLYSVKTALARATEQAAMIA